VKSRAETAAASEQTNKAKIKISWRLRGAWLEAPAAGLIHIPPAFKSAQSQNLIENSDG
jgi:hypothetical protein